MSETKRSLADKVAAARELIEEIHRRYDTGLLDLDPIRGWQLEEIVTALDAQAAEIERLQAENKRMTMMLNKIQEYIDVDATTHMLFEEKD